MRHVLSIVAVFALASATTGDEPTPEEPVAAWRLLSDGDAAARLGAIDRIESLFPDDARGVPLLVAAQDDDDPAVCEGAARAVERIGLRSVRETAAFLRRTESADLATFAKLAKFFLTLESNVVVTARDLGRGFFGGDTAGPLVAGLVDFPASASGGIAPYDAYLLLLGRASVREASDLPSARDLARASTWALGVQACGTLGPSATREIPEELRVLAEDEVTWKRWAAAALLVRTRSTSSTTTQVLDRLGSAPEKTIAATARRARESPTPTIASETLEALLGDLASPSARKRSEAEPRVLDALAGLAPADRARALAALVRRPDRDGAPYVDGAVLAPLLRFSGDARGLVPDLVTSLRGAVTEWEKIGVPPWDFLDALQEHAWKFGEAYRQRHVLADVLGRIGPSAKEAVPVLEPLASSEEPLLRYLARRSLRQIGPLAQR